MLSITGHWAALIKRLGKQPSRMEHKRIDMMMCWTNQKIYQYDVKVSSIVGDFNMAASVSKVDRSVLLTIPNPRYADKIHQYPHLQGVVMNDEEEARVTHPFDIGCKRVLQD